MCVLLILLEPFPQENKEEYISVELGAHFQCINIQALRHSKIEFLSAYVLTRGKDSIINKNNGSRVTYMILKLHFGSVVKFDLGRQSLLNAICVKLCS